MTGYESYLSSCPPKPQYRREVYYAHKDAPLIRWLCDQGVDISTERQATKITVRIRYLGTIVYDI